MNRESPRFSRRRANTICSTRAFTSARLRDIAAGEDWEARQAASKTKTADPATGFAAAKSEAEAVARLEHPHIVRESQKCVLCGRCVRVCAEVEGAIAAARAPMVELAGRSDMVLSFEAAIDGTATIGRRASSVWRLDVTGKQGHSAGVFSASKQW